MHQTNGTNTRFLIYLFMNPNIKKYEIGDSNLRNRYRDNIHIVDIREYEGCVVLIYKIYNRYTKSWDYQGNKFTEILDWNSILWGLDIDEKKELFRLNGFDWNQVKNTN